MCLGEIHIILSVISLLHMLCQAGADATVSAYNGYVIDNFIYITILHIIWFIYGVYKSGKDVVPEENYYGQHYGQRILEGDKDKDI